MEKARARLATPTWAALARGTAVLQEVTAVLRARDRRRLGGWDDIVRRASVVVAA